MLSAQGISQAAEKRAHNVGGGQLTIADNFVACLTLDMAVELSATVSHEQKKDIVLTQQSRHHRHPSRTQGRTDPASPAEPRPMTGSLGCFGTRIRWQSAVPLLIVVHIFPPRDPSYGRATVENTRRASGVKSEVGRIVFD